MGSYDVLAIIDQTHLLHPIKDHVTDAILGHSYKVCMTSTTSPANSSCHIIVCTAFWPERGGADGLQ